MSHDALPSYSNPPLVETILNVQFEPVRGLKTAHLGAFWKRLGPDWPTADDAPVVEPKFEKFSEEDRWQDLAGLSFMLAKPPSIRLQIRNATNDGMLQIQNTRMIFNWLKKEGQEYPRYPAIRQAFADRFGQFCRFLEEESLGSPQPNQWELTYLNHIPQGSVWKTVEDWTFFQPFGPVPLVPGTTRLESRSGNWHFVIGENAGRLHISWQHGRKDDRQEMIVLNLTARGPLPGRATDFNGVLSGLDLGHVAIVRSFAALIPDAEKYWGQKHANG